MECLFLFSVCAEVQSSLPGLRSLFKFCLKLEILVLVLGGMEALSQNQFDALLADYIAVRDDERELLNQQVTLFGAVVATLTLFGALVVGLGESIDLPDEIAAVSPFGTAVFDLPFTDCWIAGDGQKLLRSISRARDSSATTCKRRIGVIPTTRSNLVSRTDGHVEFAQSRRKNPKNFNYHCFFVRGNRLYWASCLYGSRVRLLSENCYVSILWNCNVNFAG